jgi:glycosyltransferase involved in cell wall biosynthesis
MSNRKLVLISQVFHPDEQSTSQLLSGLLAALAGQGFDCEALSGFPAVNAAARSVPRAESWAGIRIRRGGLAIDAKSSFAARALCYGSYCLWLAWRLLFRVPADARVLVVTNPPFAPLLIHWCSWLRGWSYDVLLHDVYPDGLVAVGKLPVNSPVARLWRGLNRRALAAAQRVLVLGRDMARLVAERYGVPADKLVYMPNWSPYEPTGRAPAEATRLWEKLGLHGRFVVQYSGNMGLWHDMECIVRAAALLHDRPDIVFLLIGQGIRRKAAEELAAQLGARNIIWLPYQDRAALDDSLACCHAALISQRAGLEGVAVPCKLYGILASGRAIIAQVPAGSEVALTVQEEQCGRVVAPGDAAALAAGIVELEKERPATAFMGERAYAAYIAKYSLASAVAAFVRDWPGRTASVAQAPNRSGGA